MVKNSRNLRLLQESFLHSEIHGISDCLFLTKILVDEK